MLKDSTILQKLRFIFFLTLSFILLYMGISYYVTNHSIQALNEIKNNKFKISTLHSENLHLLEKMTIFFQDAARMKEEEQLINAKNTKEKILENLIYLEVLQDISPIKKEEASLVELYNFSFKVTNQIMHEIKIDKQRIVKFQILNATTKKLFIQQKKLTTNSLYNAIDKLSNNQNNFLLFSLIVPTIALIIIILIALYFFNHISRRFKKVKSSLQNLNTSTPDFSKKMSVERNDEIGELVAGFNKLQHKLEKDNQRLNSLKIKAEDTARLKSEFLANMSHEIRTPMHGIIGMSYLTLQTKLNKKQKNFIEKIDNSAKMLLGIINNILDLSKIEAEKFTLEKTNFELKKMINSSVDLLRFKMEENNIKLIINYEKNLSESFYGDSLRISQVLTNLLSNAVKFTTQGTISIDIKKIKKNTFEFKITDTGIGLTIKEQKNLFKAFSQADGSTNRKYGGTGLGLVISKQLVEMMHGKIWVKSYYGQGSSFIFQIELLEILNHTPKEDYQIKIQKERDMVEQCVSALERKKILLAEDNIINQEIILGLLENSSIEIDIAKNGEEAISLHQKNKYGMILMDIQMPILDGYEATKAIRAIDKTIPIIAITASAMKEDVKKTRESGMNDHLNKPIDVNRLYELLLTYCG